MKKQYRLLILVFLLLYSFVATTVAVGLWDYNHSDSCAEPTTVSRHCITTSWQTVVDLDSKTIDGGTYSNEETKSGIVVPDIQGSGTTTLWFGDEVKSIHKGDQVQFKSWDGHYFAIVYNGKELRNYYWEPELLGFMLCLLVPAIMLYLWDLATNTGLGMNSESQLVRGISFMCHLLLGITLVLSLFGICEVATTFIF